MSNSGPALESVRILQGVPPRAHRIPAPLSPEALRPPPVGRPLVGDLLEEIVGVTGRVDRVALPEQGRCNLLAVIEEMARSLAAIHGVEAPEWTWTEWIEAALETAEHNMRHGVLDHEEFPDEHPAVVLAWLRRNRPPAAEVRLIHGDYRPKNLVWD